MGKWTAPSDLDYYESLDWPVRRGLRTCMDCRGSFLAYGEELMDPSFLCRDCTDKRRATVEERERREEESRRRELVDRR